jgi:hypothetical protein
MRQAVEIHKEREDVLVNSSSILSRRERGKVMDIAVVGSAALLRLIQPTPQGNHRQYLCESYTMDIQWTSKVPPVVKPSRMI